jgi:uncharacterized damage-inducible protein DinB
LNADYFRFIYEHLYWARDKVLTAADELSDEEFVAENGFTYKSVRGILTHAMAGESLWLPRARGEKPAGFLRPEDVPDVATLRGAWTEHETKQRAFLGTMTDEDATKDIVYSGRDGVERHTPAWQLLTLVYHHTTQHRSEAAEALTMVGHSPGDMDLLVFTRERGL